MAIVAESRIHTAIEGLPEAISSAMEEWKVPGAGVAVITDSEVLFCEGFGVRDTAGDSPVTPETVFAIGSTTKAFTTTALGILAGEGKLEWDTPIRTYMPAFTLHDVVASERTTARDLTCQRTGLPRHDLLWYGSSRSRQELFDRLRYLEPNVDFRSTWQYNNLMYMTAGMLVEAISGETWEEFVKERILDPLGMKTTTFSVEDTKRLPDYALPHAEKDGKMESIPFRSLDAVGPAGSINASVREMAAWAQLQLSGGKHGDRQIISEGMLAQLHSPQMAVQMPSQYPEMVHAAYGLGWVVQPYRGHNMVWHNGGIDGFYALIAFLPVEKVGVVVLTNYGQHSMSEIVTYRIFDRVLGTEPAPWSERMKEAVAKGKEAQEKAKAEQAKGRVEGTQPSHPLRSFVGEYEHPGYGTLEIALVDGKLHTEYHGLATGLEHFHYDIFMADSERLAGVKARFTTGKDGAIESVALPLEPAVTDIVFTQKSEPAPSVQPALGG